VGDKKLVAAGQTHVGQTRDENQDSLLVSTAGIAALPNLFIVADGLGGHNAGSIASNGAMEAFCDFLNNTDADISHEYMLALAINYANSQVFKDAAANRAHKGMGTTFTSAVISGNLLYYAHVGDSRIYTIKNGQMTQITTDHASCTVEMVADGIISECEAQNYPEKVLTRAVGTDAAVEADKGVADLDDATHILLCTDGLTNMLFENQILEIIESNANVENATKQLIDAANKAGGKDNITAIVIGWDRL